MYRGDWGTRINNTEYWVTAQSRINLLKWQSYICMGWGRELKRSGAEALQPEHQVGGQKMARERAGFEDSGL
jgi:hypothetical protein